jgi:predicted DNA-binding WGR domain protein
METGGRVLLHRINSEKNEARFYLVETGPSLVDLYAVIRLWGRISGHQRGMVTPCRSAVEAEALAAKLVRRKLKRGYLVVE